MRVKNDARLGLRVQWSEEEEREKSEIEVSECRLSNDDTI